MNVTPTEIRLARMWAEEHCGEDDPLEVMEWKLLEIAKKGTARSADFHDRQNAEIATTMDELATKWATVPPEVDDDHIDF